MHAMSHPVSSYSIVGVVIGVIFVPTIILSSLFLLTKILLGP
jgi:hypothetical protein